MSRPIADQELRDIRRLLSMTVGSETSISVRTVDKITEELLALRAEVERLRAVEQAARMLNDAISGDRRLLRYTLLWATLAAALDANEGSKP